MGMKGPQRTNTPFRSGITTIQQIKKQKYLKTGCHSKKLNKELPYDPTILLLGVHPEELKLGCRHSHINVPHTSGHDGQKADTIQMPIKEMNG